MTFDMDLTKGINSEYVQIPFADQDGAFYCRCCHAVLQERRKEQVCGIGCPYFCGTDDGGKVKCFYMEHVEKEKLSSADMWKKVENDIKTGKEPLFPICEDLPPRLQKAYSYAASMHEGQNRKGTQIPYFSHLITTMNYAMELTDDVEILAAAVLHDTLEDTYATLLDLQMEFGSVIASYVAAETENKRIGSPADVTWEMRKYENIAHLQKSPYEVKIIVLSDKTANAESMAKEWSIVGDRLWEKFNQKDKRKQEWYYRGCEKALSELSDTKVMKIFRAYLYLLFS